METAKLSTDTNAHVSSISNTCSVTKIPLSSNYKNDTYDTHDSATMENESHADGMSIYSANTSRKLSLPESNKNVLKIATINMKNFHSNKAYLQELTKHHDVICKQEHWLFNYEKENLQRFNDFSGLIKCIDDLNPISPFQRIKRYSGCGTLWNNKLNSKVIPVQYGGKRLATILLEMYNPNYA
jgi:hypothetical protein